MKIAIATDDYENVAGHAVKVMNGEALPDPRWDASLLLCRLRDVFSKH